MSLSHAEQDKAILWYDKIGQDYSIELFEGINSRGIFTVDPEGNVVELVAKLTD